MKRNAPKRMKMRNGVAKGLQCKSFAQKIKPSKRGERESKQKYQKALLDKETDI